MNFRKFTPCAIAVCLLWAGGVAFAQNRQEPTDQQPPSSDTPFPTESRQREKKPKKYSEVVTDKAKSSSGLFTVHRVEEKTYYEIPAAMLGREMLWTTEVAKVPPGIGYGGLAVGNRVVRWERRNNKVYLRVVSYRKRAFGDSPIQEAVDAAMYAPIAAAFDVETEGKDKAPVIEVTKLLTSDTADFSAQRLFASLRLTNVTVDSNRSYVEEIKTLPINIEARSTITFNLARTGGASASSNPPPAPRVPDNVRSLSILVHYSMVLLPEKPMTGRYFDSRVGYFAEDFEDYSDKDGTHDREFITRYRLEKKDPKATLSEPVSPIVYYVSREVPTEWRPYVKKGVEAWQEAFEAAGFKNAIICKDAPTPAEDPTWDPEDARFSVVRWAAQKVQNAMGPNVHDPRSGEIISAHIIMWHDILKLNQSWYFAQCGALDPRAQKLPMPTELTGELLRYVVTHEVGHTLGLRHNHRASSAYSIAQLRDPAFTEKNGDVASIMSYGRFNYVAQPEDKVKRLIPKIGPYDKFAIEWGYKPLNAATPDAEKPLLDQIAARQITDPLVRFGGEDGPAQVDPTVNRENLGTDPIEATALGLKNLDRVADLVVPATEKLGEDYELLEEMYNAMLSHRARWLGHVVKLVGGVVENRHLGGRGEESFTRVPEEKQRQAVKFVLENGLTTPAKLVQPSIVGRFKYFGVGDQIMNQQRTLLESLLSAQRYKLLTDGEVMSPESAYTVLELVADVQNGVWSELDAAEPRVDVYRRALQRAYLDHVKKQLDETDRSVASTGDPDTDEILRIAAASSRQSDFRAVARGALRELAARIDAGLMKTKDAMSVRHLQDCRKEIEDILDSDKR